MTCEHEWQMKSEGWEQEITLSVWAKEGEEERQIHFHAPDEMVREDMDSLIDYLERQRAERFSK